MLKKISIYSVCCFLILVLFSCANSRHAEKEISNLDGTWELLFLQNDESTEALFPTKKPTMVLNTASSLISGSAGCNNYSGSFKVSEKMLDLSAPMAATKIMCASGMEGEQAFLTTLPKVNAYIIMENELSFMEDSKMLMKFKRNL